MRLKCPGHLKNNIHRAQRIKKTERRRGTSSSFTQGKSKSVSHVGVYLRNNKFIHASSSGGVMISDLDDEYCQAEIYVASGRYKS
jgi:lipoprotein Spr